MSLGWTKREVDAELTRRKAEREANDEQFRKAHREAEMKHANAECICCHNPVFSYDEYPICVACDSD